jgi:hypothetical protein
MSIVGNGRDRSLTFISARFSPETVCTAALSNVDARIRPERECEAAFYAGTFYLEQGDWVEATRRLRAACQHVSLESHRAGSGKGGIDATAVAPLDYAY